MPANCSHLDTIREVTPSARGCEECLKTGSVWVHLRLCRTCGHVGCCDDSPNRHATKHFHATGHPIIEGYDPPRGMGLVLYRGDLARSLRPCHAAARSNPTLLLKLRVRGNARVAHRIPAHSDRREHISGRRTVAGQFARALLAAIVVVLGAAHMIASSGARSERLAPPPRVPYNTPRACGMAFARRRCVIGFA